MATLLTKSDVGKVIDKYVRCEIKREDTLSEFISKVEETVIYNAEEGYVYDIEMPDNAIMRFEFSNISLSTVFSDDLKFKEFRDSVMLELVDVLHRYNVGLADAVKEKVNNRR